MQPDGHQLHGILQSATLVEAHLRRQLEPLGLLPRQARIIEAMARMGPVSQINLAKAFAVTPASISTMTDRLFAAGYITRKVDPSSRRQQILELTDKGRALLGEIALAWTVVDNRIRAALGENAATYFDLARQLRDNLGGTIPGHDSKPAD